jgi:hypothetical protein
MKNSTSPIFFSVTGRFGEKALAVHQRFKGFLVPVQVFIDNPDVVQTSAFSGSSFRHSRRTTSAFLVTAQIIPNFVGFFQQ